MNQRAAVGRATSHLTSYRGKRNRTTGVRKEQQPVKQESRDRHNFRAARFSEWTGCRLESATKKEIDVDHKESQKEKPGKKKSKTPRPRAKAHVGVIKSPGG